MTSAIRSHLDSIICPRCGYDLHGMVDSWREQCPISGNCAECGLPFDWGELLNRQLNMPGWCVESPFVRTRRAWLWASFRTLWMSLRPWRFWRELKMTHDMKLRRIVWYPLLLLILLYPIFAFSVGLAAWSFSSRISMQGFTLNGSPLTIGIRSAALPLSQSPIYQTGGPWVGKTPRAMATRYFPILIPFSLGSALKKRQFADPGIGIYLPVKTAHALLILILAPLGFIALPITRRICRIRRVHLARIWLYCLPLVLFPLGVDILAQINLGSTFRVRPSLILRAGDLVFWGTS
ncbi:MAG: hypothetical protein O7G85_16100, partial [Planctomycetota bacterium]|nr:hypothetical protein [Planctomycetota bacterium]